ncbi:uncharacterized protein LOC135693432 isoform X3 [Rhopilema esculentum]|uniref:uncharacterized protein LOC135693432 isoform X3 n=1 Tax=Rhopilema esculentum TaxID=499914 RepID=UPI0031D00C5B
MLISLGAWILGLCAVLVGAYDPMENPDLLQGDMELTEEQRNAYLNGEANSAVPLAAVKSGLWPKVIPYEVDEKLAKEPKAVEAIDAAIAEYHQKTCLRFVKRKNEQGYLDFYMGSGCSSPVGYYGQRSGISLSDGCWHKGIVMHEIAHSLGFYHEQSRPDRDHYVIIHWENIKQNMRYNFHKQKASNIDSMSVPYDYRSIMHYGRTAFGRGKLTIETRDPTMQRVIGRRSGFSDYDVLQMNLLYKCPGFTRPPKQSLPPISEVSPTTAPITGDCKDKTYSCTYYKERGYCTRDIFVQYMRENCPRICGFCKPGSIEAGGLAVGLDGCIDTITFCDFYVKKNYCTHPKFGDYMKRNCPLSCKFCKPGEITQPPLVTRPPVTVPFTTPDCMDTIHYCEWYMKKGYCTDDRFQDYMKRNCPKTCEICKPATAKAESFADACMDTIHFCDFYVRKGYCTHSKFGDYMKRNCPLSCKLCKKGEATQPPLVTKQPVTVPFTTPDCMDTIHYCIWYKKRGHCSNDHFKDYMEKNCPKTCGFCKADGASYGASNADACIDTIHYCQFYIKKQYCNHPKFGEYMKRNCPRSCKFCEPGVATQPPLVTRPPVTAPFTTPDCMDTIHFCKWYKSKGYCKDERFVDYMTKNCPKTCEICKPDGPDAGNLDSGVFAPGEDACMDTIHYCNFYVKKGYCSSPPDDLVGDYMKRNCPFSCKFCKKGVATQPPLVTRPPVTVPFTTPDCMDTIHFCNWYKMKGYCTDDRFMDYMTRNCPKTCEMCKPDVYAPGEDACMDTIHFCDFYVKKGYCSSPPDELVGDYMKRNCPLSCKFCKKGEATQPPLVTRPPVTVPFTTPDCMDTIHYCNWYKKKGYCTDDRFMDYMTRNCPKTCEMCKAGAFAPGEDACMDTIHYCNFYVKKGYCSSPPNDLVADYMKRNCPLSCKFCKKGEATQPPLVTRPPVTVPFTTPDCMDTIHYCAWYKQKGYCTDDRFMDYMTRNCPKTCEMCKAGAFAPGEDACMDTIHYCNFYVRKGYCSSPPDELVGDYMKRNCPLSCKFCKKGEATQPPLVTRPPRTVPFTTPACMDTIHYCKWYKQKGYCTDDRFMDYMTRNCPKTCEMCKAGAFASGKDCKDIVPNCDLYKLNGFCSDERFIEFMRRNCPKTCDMCKSGVFAPGEDACMDTIHYCDFYVKKGYCSRPEGGIIGDYMKRNCPLSCKFCKKGVATQPPLATRPPVTVPFTTPDCMDTIHFCDWYKNKGYCTDDRFMDYMFRNCPKTCDMCKPDVFASGKDSCIDTIGHCDYYVKKGYCTHKRYASYMKRNCPKSCKFCKPGEATQPPVVTRPPRTVPVTTSGGTKRPTNAPATGVVTNPPSAGTCGMPDIAQSRVIAGEDAKKGAWPWQILMLFMNSPMCGGALVAPNWVVTAAHCVSGKSAMRFKIRVGEHKFTVSSEGKHQDIQVQKVIPHPQYSRQTLNNDIALMKLSLPVTFGKYVKPVCLPDHDQEVPIGTKCFITGWGKIKHPGRMHHTLQQGKMPVVSNDKCSSLNTKNLGIKITENMVCAGHGGSTRVSGCHGDSGGPFVCQTGPNGSWVLHGAVSWGSGRCDATQGYTVFARVSKYKKWIDQMMARN